LNQVGGADKQFKV